MLISLFYFISGEEPYHGCTDIKPLLLLLLLLLLLSIQNGEQTVPCGFSLDYRCSVDGRKRYENDKCGRKSF